MTDQTTTNKVAIFCSAWRLGDMIADFSLRHFMGFYLRHSMIIMNVGRARIIALGCLEGKDVHQSGKGSQQKTDEDKNGRLMSKQKY